MMSSPHHRVQVVIRGQRYEMDMRVATATCRLFRIFFENEFDVSDFCAGVQPSTTSLLSASEDAEFRHMLAANAVFLKDVWYRLVAQELERCRWGALSLEDDVEVGKFRGVWDSIREGAGMECQGTPEALELSPWMSPPQSVDFQAEKRTWVFCFASRIPVEELADTFRSCEGVPLWKSRTATAYRCCLMTRGEERVGVEDKITEELQRRINDDPFLLLQPEFVGSIFVFLRRLHAAAALDKGAPSPSVPVFPIRWKELTSPQRLSIRYLIQVLGVIPLLPLSCTPAEDTGERAPRRDKHVEVEEEEEHQSLFPVACGRCGTVGHTVSQCPFELSGTGDHIKK